MKFISTHKGYQIFPLRLTKFYFKGILHQVLNKRLLISKLFGELENKFQHFYACGLIWTPITVTASSWCSSVSDTCRAAASLNHRYNNVSHLWNYEVNKTLFNIPIHILDIGVESYRRATLMIRGFVTQWGLKLSVKQGAVFFRRCLLLGLILPRSRILNPVQNNTPF